MILILKRGHLKWISEALLPIIKIVPGLITVDIRLFTTGTIEKGVSLIDSPTEDPKTPLSITQGRPDVQGIIKEEIFSATGDISVNGTLLFHH